MKYPKALEKIIESFQLYPGIGPKTAERLAFFTFYKLKDEEVVEFSQSLLRLKSELGYCLNCGLLTDQRECEICLDETRQRKLIIVEV